MTERGLKNINVFYSTFTNVFFIFVTFFTSFNVSYFFSGTFFTSMISIINWLFFCFTCYQQRRRLRYFGQSWLEKTYRLNFRKTWNP